jgi:hypothetical protein
VRSSAGKHFLISAVDVAVADDSKEVSFMAIDIDVRSAFVCNCAFCPKMT